MPSCRVALLALLCLKRNARWLADIVERMMADDRTLPVGGLSIYRRNAVHGPFVHLDARGQRARW